MRAARLLAAVLAAASLGCGGLAPDRSKAAFPAPQARDRTPLPTSPAPQPAPEPDPEAGAVPAPAPPAPGRPAPNRLRSDDGRLDVAVGSYDDCTGDSPVARGAAGLDPCFIGRLYFVGHNPGVFSPLTWLGVGDRIAYSDPAGSVRTFQVIAVRVMARNRGMLPVSGHVTAQFQTCEVADGTIVRVLDAVDAQT